MEFTAQTTTKYVLTVAVQAKLALACALTDRREGGMPGRSRTAWTIVKEIASCFDVQLSIARDIQSEVPGPFSGPVGDVARCIRLSAQCELSSDEPITRARIDATEDELRAHLARAERAVTPFLKEHYEVYKAWLATTTPVDAVTDALAKADLLPKTAVMIADELAETMLAKHHFKPEDQNM